MRSFKYKTTPPPPPPPSQTLLSRQREKRKENQRKIWSLCCVWLVEFEEKEEERKGLSSWTLCQLLWWSPRSLVSKFSLYISFCVTLIQVYIYDVLQCSCVTCIYDLLQCSVWFDAYPYVIFFYGSMWFQFRLIRVYNPLHWFSLIPIPVDIYISFNVTLFDSNSAGIYMSFNDIQFESYYSWYVYELQWYSVWFQFTTDTCMSFNDALFDSNSSLYMYNLQRYFVWF